MKIIRVVLSPEAERVYRKLNEESKTIKQSRMILKAINNKISLIKENVHYGDPLSKNLIPEEYKKRYSANNLFRVELPLFWRMIYTLTNNNELEIVTFILEIFNHKDYNKKFGYKNK